MTELLAIRSGQEVITTLKEFCQRNGVKTGLIVGIGGCKSAELGHFTPEKGEFHKVKLNEQLEITSLLGNVTLVDGKPFIHLHANLSDRSMNVRGGHVFSLHANPFVEAFIQVSDVIKEKELDSDLNIYVMK